MNRRTAKKLLDRCALEFCLGGHSRYVVPEHLACRSAVRLPGHPFVRLMVATDALVFGDDDRHDLDPTDDDDGDWSYVSLDDEDRDEDDDILGCWEGGTFRRGLCPDDLCHGANRCMAKPRPWEGGDESSEEVPHE